MSDVRKSTVVLTDKNKKTSTDNYKKVVL